MEDEDVGERIEHLRSLGFVEQGGGMFRLTEEGMEMLRDLAVFLEPSAIALLATEIAAFKREH